MDWQKLLSTKRLGAEVDNLPPRPGRSEFESDVDRITFSSAFRRLGRKTQVHPLAANDHIHTRLTHSLEVSRVGKALGKALGSELKTNSAKYRSDIPVIVSADDIGNVVQAACLAHDLGNPPFGHAGEEAIIHWFDQNRKILPEGMLAELKHDIGALEGNAQGFRIVTQLENHVFKGGLRLTYATLGAFQKYPWTSRRLEKKFGSYITEEIILDRVFDEMNIPRRQDNTWCRHPLAYLVEAADDICYGIIDIEDAVELGILRFADATDVIRNLFNDSEWDFIHSQFADKRMFRVNFARLRGHVFDKVTGGVVSAFLTGYDKIMNGDHTGTVFDFLENDDPRRLIIGNAKKIGRDKIYTDAKKIEIEIGCYATFDTLLSEFCQAAIEQADVLKDQSGQTKLKWKSAHILRLLGDHAPSLSNAPEGGWTTYECVRRVIDFVGGMTDNYATYIAKQLQGAGFSGGQRP